MRETGADRSNSAPPIKLRSSSLRQVIRRTSAELPSSVKRQKAGLHVILQPGNMSM